MKAGLWIVAAMLAAATAACGNSDKDEQAEADARAASFQPPSVMSRLDFGSSASRRFRALDRNGDDIISDDELPRPEAPRLMALDRNGDGEITESEWSEGMLARFDRMDLNQDGTVTSEERRTAMARQQAQPAK
jgi:hypothetical protein